MKTGIKLIADERKRQVAEEDWSADHDDGHDKFELTRAAIAYAKTAKRPIKKSGWIVSPSDWPWYEDEWKPSADPIRNLVKAGALIAAEIDRLRRQPEGGRE